MVYDLREYGSHHRVRFERENETNGVQLERERDKWCAIGERENGTNGVQFERVRATWCMI